MGSGDDGNEDAPSKSLQIKSRCQRDEDFGGPKNKFSIVNFAKDLLGITSITEIASQYTESISSQVKEVEQPTDPLTKLLLVKIPLAHKMQKNNAEKRG